MTSKLRFNTAKELFEAFPSASADMKAAPTDQPSIEFCRAQLAGRIPEEAVTFCAYLLPRRVAVWWGHQCLSHIPDALDDQDRAMLQLAEDWVRDPEEDRRYAALDQAMAAEMKTPGVWIALAAGWSGGSLSPRGLAPVTPQPFLTARAVNAGILGGLARVATAQRVQMLGGFVEMGITLAEN